MRIDNNFEDYGDRFIKHTNKTSKIDQSTGCFMKRPSTFIDNCLEG